MINEAPCYGLQVMYSCEQMLQYIVRILQIVHVACVHKCTY